MTQTKRDTLLFQVAVGGGMRLTTPPCKSTIVMKPKKNRGVQGPLRAVELMMNRVFTTFLSQQHIKTARHFMLGMMSGGSIYVLTVV
jgi:hypothetical protein